MILGLTLAILEDMECISLNLPINIEFTQIMKKF